MRVYIVCAAFIAASGAWAAPGDPEEVYAEFHRALLQDDYDKMVSLSTEGKRRRANADWAKNKPTTKGAEALAPDYRVLSKNAGPERTVLKLTGKGGSAQPHTIMAGEVILLKEADGWRVHDMTWKPSDGPPPPPPVAAAASAPAPARLRMDDPEAVYAAYHRAMMEGDLATIDRVASEAARRRMFPDDREKIAKRQAGFLISPFYSVTGRAIGANRAVLNTKGQAGPALGGGPMNSKVTLVKEGGEWKVDEIMALGSGGPDPLANTPPPVMLQQQPPPRPVSAGSGGAVGAPARAQ